MGKLEEIKKRAEEATPGPWEVTISNDDYPPVVYSVFTSDYGDTVAQLSEEERAFLREGPLSTESADAWFIANARTDVPRLVAALEGVLEHVDACLELNYRVDGDYIKWLVKRELEREPSTETP